MAPDEWERQLRRADQLIDQGWLAALCVALWQGFIGALAMADKGAKLSFNLVYAGLLVVLAFGVARRNRVAAFALVAQVLVVGWLMARVNLWMLLFTVAFVGYWYVRGVQGVLWWHRLMKEEPGQVRKHGAAA